MMRASACPELSLFSMLLDLLCCRDVFRTGYCDSDLQWHTRVRFDSNSISNCITIMNQTVCKLFDTLRDSRDFSAMRPREKMLEQQQAGAGRGGQGECGVRLGKTGVSRSSR